MRCEKDSRSAEKSVRRLVKVYEFQLLDDKSHLTVEEYYGSGIGVPE